MHSQLIENGYAGSAAKNPSIGLPLYEVLLKIVEAFRQSTHTTSQSCNLGRSATTGTFSRGIHDPAAG